MSTFDENTEHEDRPEFDDNGEPIIYIEEDVIPDEFASEYDGVIDLDVQDDSFYETVWGGDASSVATLAADDSTTGEQVTDPLEVEVEQDTKDTRENDGILEQANEDYNNAVDTLINILTQALAQGEITEEMNASILDAQGTKTKNEQIIKEICNVQEDNSILKQLADIKANMVAASVDDILDILTQGGTKPWLYKDSDNNVLVDGQSIPELTVLVNKLNLIATGGDEASEIQLTPEFINLISTSDIKLQAKNITLEGLVTANENFKILKDGSIVAKNGTFTGKIFVGDGSVIGDSALSETIREGANNGTLAVQKLETVNADIENLKADKADITDLNATNAEIDNLKANKVDIEYLDANYATIQQLNAANANISNLQANKANITDLNATNANISNLNATVGNIQTLVNGNLTSDNIQSMVITGDKFTVANGFIKNAMIDSVSANKINTGTINTNNVSIQSEDGSMIINGTTQQFKDENGKVRIQIGKDATGNFTFALFSQDGVGVLIDENGIKSGAVPNGLIVNDMVADGANISGSKLDINSVISSINNNENTLNSSKIKFDDTNQTLDVAFNQLKSKVETIENITVDGDLSSVIEQVTTNTTNISVMQGQISSLISNTTITKQDGTVTQLKDEYNSIKDTVNSHTQTIGSLETNLSTAEDNIKTVTSKQAKFEQSLDGFKQTVHETYVTKTEVEKTLKSVTNEYYISTSNTELIDGSWSTTVPTPQANKYIWRRERSEFVDGSITYGDPICLTNENEDGYTILLTKDTITCLWDSSGDLGGGGDSGSDNPSGGDSPALTISNISAKSIIEGAAFGISYTTNKTVSKHYISWNASSSNPTYTNITSYVSSSGNSHQYLENDNTQAIGTYNVAIKVVTADGESKVSNVFRITITAPSSGGGDSGGNPGGNTGSDLTGTYLFFGDSICYGGGTGGYGYPEAIKAKQPSMTSLNYSKSGTCIARNDSYDVKYPSILSKIQATSIAADYIVLEGGVNDSWGNRNPIGTFKGGTAPTTSSAMISYGNSLNEYQFADALEKCIIEIKLKWWGKKVFYVIPHPINQSYSNPYFNLAIQICNKWGVKVIDLRNSGCTSADTTDGTHPTRAAYDNYYAPNIINVLKANK